MPAVKFGKIWREGTTFQPDSAFDTCQEIPQFTNYCVFFFFKILDDFGIAPNSTVLSLTRKRVNKAIF